MRIVTGKFGQRFYNFFLIAIPTLFFLMNIYMGLPITSRFIINDFIIGCSIVSLIGMALLCIKKQFKCFNYSHKKYYLLIMLLVVLNASFVYGVLSGNVMIFHLYFLVVEEVCFFVLILIYENENELFWTGLKVLEFIIFCTAIYGIFEYITKYNIIEAWFNPLMPYKLFGSWEDFRVQAIYRNPIPASHVFIIAFWFPFFGEKKLSYKAVRNIVYLAAIILCKERTEWIAFILTLLIYLMISNKSHEVREHILEIWNKKTTFWKIVIIIIMLVFLTYIISEISSRFIFSGLTSSEAFIVRSSRIRFFFDSVLPSTGLIELLFGRGFESSITLIDAANLPVDRYDCFENGYLTIFTEYGCLVLVCVLCLFVKGVKFIIDNKNKIGSNNSKCAFGVLVSIIPILSYDTDKYHGVLFLILISFITIAGSIKNVGTSNKSNIV